MLGDRHCEAFANETHFVGACPLPARHKLWGELAGRGSEAADIDILLLFTVPGTHGQQADPQDGMSESPASDVIGAGGPVTFEAGMKESLKVDQHRVLAGRDEIFTMKVTCLQGIEKSKTAALTPVEAGKFFCGFTRRGRDEFGPSVTAAIKS